MTEDTLRDAHPARDSWVEMTEIVMPNDANPLGNLMGGRVMQWIDIAAAITAGRHSRRQCVTANVDGIDWLAPVKVGSVVVLKASVNYVGTTSLECGVKVWSEDKATGDRTHVASAYLTFVALDTGTGRPIPIPRLLSETEDEKRRYEAAKLRREHKMAQRGHPPSRSH
ncbi:MAG: acyl-CoA thioesterase [Planctomycetes bacterium]|jgi:acyl-CoA hydrolase|nr:acyl-CoA thioesterase [Planctomycetota bacterium]MDP6423134.1 acyl-CoA thioesterase [Planctomycetota bacterium]